MAPLAVQGEHPINYKLIDTTDELRKCIKDIEKCDVIAVDLEGVDLCREGPITILSIGTPSLAYLIDIVILKKDAFTNDIVRILEEHPKIMYDCRTDSDALFHQYGVTLGNVTDLQLMNVLVQEANGEVNIQKFNNRMKIVKPGQELLVRYQFLRGLKGCMEDYLSSSRYFKAKDKVQMQKEGSEFWAKRPLSADVLKYASADVLALFQLRNMFAKKCSLNNPRLRLASKRFESIKRDREQCSTCKLLDSKALLPLEIIPPPRGEETVQGRIRCVGCQRDLPDKYFSKHRPDMSSHCAVCRRALAREATDREKKNS